MTALLALLRVLTFPATGWILSTGLWNDAAVWIDTATWNDGS